MTNCTKCDRPKHRGRCKRVVLNTLAVPADAIEEMPPPVEIIVIEPSMGARLRPLPGMLEIEQDRLGEDGELYTHVISLTAHEAGRVIDAISKWVQKAA